MDSVPWVISFQHLQTWLLFLKCTNNETPYIIVSLNLKFSIYQDIEAKIHQYEGASSDKSGEMYEMRGIKACQG